MSRHNEASVALLAAVATIVVGLAASAGASAATAGKTGADRGAAGWAEAPDTRQGLVPTLTNDVGQPAAGAESQLQIGFGLLAAGLLGLVYGLAVLRATHRRRGPVAMRPARRAPIPRAR